MINGPETIYFEKSGLLRPYRGQGFYSEEGPARGLCQHRTVLAAAPSMTPT